MKQENKGTTIQILGKPYHIKCPDEEIAALEQAAHYLEQKMQSMRESTNGLNADRIAIIAALNIVHQLLTSEQQKESHLNCINEKLHELQIKVDEALFNHKQMELEPVE